MEKLIVAPYVTVGIQNNIFYFGFGSIQFEETNAEVAKGYLNILRYFKTPHTVDEAASELAHISNFLELFIKLRNQNFFINFDFYSPTDRFNRQALFFDLSGIDHVKAQPRLSNKKIAIIGCGGIGNQVSVHLATAGVENFILCDADHIEVSNLSRQILFTESDVGESKAKVLARELIARNSNIEVSIVNEHIMKTDQLDFAKSADFIVVSADAGNVVNMVNEFCVRNEIPYMNVGYVNDIAVWGPLYIPKETGCYSCQDIIANEGDRATYRDLIREINNGYQAPSVGPVNMISSGLACLDILKFLAGHPEKTISLNRRVGLWTNTLKLEFQDCTRNENCKTCGDSK